MLAASSAAKLAEENQTAFQALLEAQYLLANKQADYASIKANYLESRTKLDSAIGLKQAPKVSWFHSLWLLILSVIVAWSHLPTIDWTHWIPIIPVPGPTVVVNTKPFHAVMIVNNGDFAQAKATATFRSDSKLVDELKAVDTTWALVGHANPTLATRGYVFTDTKLPLLLILEDGTKTPLYRGAIPADPASLVTQIKTLRGLK